MRPPLVRHDDKIQQSSRAENKVLGLAEMSLAQRCSYFTLSFKRGSTVATP